MKYKRNERLEQIIKRAERCANPETEIYDAYKAMVKLIREFYRYLKMDKKMRKVTKEMKVAEKDVKAGKKKAAVKVLKKAEKKNAKLADYDEKVRDPIIEKCKRASKGKK